MTYFTGTVSSLSALRQALIDACTLGGWGWDATNEVLSRGAAFLRLQVSGVDLVLTGRTSATSGDAPNVVTIGKMFSRTGYPTYELTWPATYHIFTFANPDEVFMVVNYSVDRYQWCAYGLSSVSEMPGSGMWVAATNGALIADNNATKPIVIGTSFGAVSDIYQPNLSSAALAWNNAGGTYGSNGRNLHIHSNLDGQGWWLGQSLTAAPVGIGAAAPLIATQPSAWNSEAVLLPIRGYKIRPSNTVSLTLDLANARYIRVDNYAPGEVIALGSERWKVFPWHLKNTVVRNGSAQQNSSYAIDHTGTFGWAIRYEGP